ncbi:cytochrome bd oxidase small subunit CydS [Metasolibacillus fluoroglycofenilyticus]
MVNDFLIFVAPFLVVVLSVIAAFFVATRASWVDEE